MKSIIMPSQKKLYTLGDGWFSKETKDGARGLYHESILRNLRKPTMLDYLFDRKGMATIYSDTWTLARAGRRDKPNASNAKESVLLWDFASLPVGNIGDVLVCGKLYKGDRVVGGNEAHGAHTGASGSYGTYLVDADGITLGASDSAARFLAATSMNGAGNTALAPTIALGFMYEATADLFLVCVNSVAALATAGRVTGKLNVVRT
jgi:hypothetical protein